MNNRKNDKRTRLVEAANQLFHEQGVSITTLANIATLAGVPLGNVYYYFKSKESIILAVIELQRQRLQTQLQAYAQHGEAKARLKAFISERHELQSSMAAHGDALGSLCQELSKQPGAIAEAASQPLRELIEWCAQQFKELGKTNSQELALNLVSTVQGTSLLTLTFKDTTVLQNQLQYLLNWVQGL